MKEELRLLIKKTETQSNVLKDLINIKQTKADLERFITVKKFVDGFLIDLKNIEKL
jgi:hypothetical protein